jgi:hypothetical protein
VRLRPDAGRFTRLLSVKPRGRLAAVAVILSLTAGAAVVSQLAGVHEGAEPARVARSAVGEAGDSALAGPHGTPPRSARALETGNHSGHTHGASGLSFVLSAVFAAACVTLLWSMRGRREHIDGRATSEKTSGLLD